MQEIVQERDIVLERARQRQRTTIQKETKRREKRNHPKMATGKNCQQCRHIPSNTMHSPNITIWLTEWGTRKVASYAGLHTSNITR